MSKGAGLTDLGRELGASDRNKGIPSSGQTREHIVFIEKLQ